MKKKFYKLVTAQVLALSMLSATLPSASVLASQPSSQSTAITKEGTRLYVVDGRILEFDGSQSIISEQDIQMAKMERGKWSLAAKAIKKAYFKVPAGIRKYINQYTGIRGILVALEHFTGWIEDGIYQACKNAGMPDWMAWLVAKALTLVAL